MTELPSPRSDLPGASALIAEAGRRFRRRFGRPPRFAAVAPARVNLIGEHTDYNDGLVLPMAIDRYAAIVADAADQPRSTLFAMDLDEAVQVDLPAKLIPMTEPRWSNYLLGVIQQFIERGDAPPPLDIALTSTVPIGAGLSSSAAIEVAMATLLEQVLGIRLGGVEKALLCRQAEHEFPGTPCGIMDMFIAALAWPNHTLLIDCRSHEARPIRMPPADEAVLLIADTGVKHELASGAYADRRATCQRVAQRLGVPALRDATTEMLEAAGLTQIEHQRAMHVVLENQRTQQAAELLDRGRVEEFGELMFQSHESLRYLYQVSCPEADCLVDAARSRREPAAGVLGARMTGGGFGGCVIVLCRPDAAGGVAERLGKSFFSAFGRIPPIFTTDAVGGAVALARGGA